MTHSVSLLWGDLSKKKKSFVILLKHNDTLLYSSQAPALERRKPQSLLQGFLFNVASNSAIKRPSGVSPCSRSPAPDSDLLLPSGKITLGACQRSHDNRDS